MKIMHNLVEYELIILRKGGGIYATFPSVMSFTLPTCGQRIPLDGHDEIEKLLQIGGAMPRYLVVTRAEVPAFFDSENKGNGKIRKVLESNLPRVFAVPVF